MSELIGSSSLTYLSLLIGLALIAGALKIALDSVRAKRVSERLFAGSEVGLEGSLDTDTGNFAVTPSRLDLWLTRAGHRARNASANFIAAILGCALLAGLLVWGLLRSGAVEALSALFAGLPVVGPGVSGAISVFPFVTGFALAGLPVWLVQRDRARRVEDIERDLPLVLELLSTLAEAGFGFESAVSELLRAQPAGRPLADEFRIYQLEVSAGGRRSESLARLASRVDLASVSSFTSALRHGEETGASIAGLLRPQANLVRQRRRERALATAEALPEKLVVPLLVGFLPGLLVWTLGPAFFQLFEMIDAALG
ncbi:MAG: type II secretion system F family protein [Myxococcota bacterium]